MIVVSLDEPKGIAETGGYATGGMVSAPSVKAIIENIVSLYGILPGDWSSQIPARCRSRRRRHRTAARRRRVRGDGHARPGAGSTRRCRRAPRGQRRRHRECVALRLSELMRQSDLAARSRRVTRRRPDARLPQGPARLSVRRSLRLQGRRCELRCRCREARRRRSILAGVRCGPAAARSGHRRGARSQSAPPHRADGGNVRRPAARDHRRRHRHQRQELDRPFRAPHLGGARLQGRQRRHAGHRLAGLHARRRPDHARSRAAPCRSRDPGARRRDASRDRGLEPRPRPASPRRAASSRRRPSPISRTSISTITSRWTPTSRPRRGCSRRCCRRAAPPSSMPTAIAPPQLAEICRPARHPLLDLRREGRGVPAGPRHADAARPASRDRGAGPPLRGRAAAGRRLPGLQRAGGARAWSSRPAAMSRAPWRRWRP